MSSWTIHNVRMARFSSDTNATSKVWPACAMRRAASCASATPFGVRSTSVQPVKRFSRFHVLSPWRSRTSFIMRWSVLRASRRCHGGPGVHQVRPHGTVIADLAGTGQGADAGAIAELEAPDRDVVPREARDRRADAPGQPLEAVAHEEIEDPLGVEVSGNDDPRMARGIGQDRLRLVAPAAPGDAARRLEVNAVHANG